MSAKKPPRDAAARGYAVGYGRPPKHSRFKPGRSGNPKGRPKGVRSFKTDVNAVLKAPVRVTQDGKPRRVSTQEAMLLRLREKALGGDARALDRLLGLAQAYNNEELAAVSQLPAGDAMLLDLFRARVLSGAADGSPPADGGAGARGDEPATASPDTDARPERKGKRKRVRLKKPRRLNGGPGVKPGQAN